MIFRAHSWFRAAVFGLAVSAAVWTPCFGAAVDADVASGWEAYHRQDEEKALRLFKKASARGVATAYAGLGQLYFDGNVVEMNVEEAIRLYEKGAAANDPEAMMRLADWLRFDGEGRPADYKRARELLKRVIAVGGVDENENVRRAGEWLAEIEKTAKPPLAAEVPQASAPLPQPASVPTAPAVSREDMQWAVQLEERKKSGYRPSAAEEARYKAVLAALSKPAGKPGQAEYDQAEAAAKAGEADRAFMLLVLAAQAGHVQAMMEASDVFFKLGKPENLASGLFWLSKAAEAGDPDAVKRMAQLKAPQAGAEDVAGGRKAYEKKNYAEAVARFKKAMELGSPAGPRLLGVLYEEGRGVEKNVVEARRLYAEGVARQDADAYLSLAELTRAGVGGPRDLAEAKRLYERLKTDFASVPKAVGFADEGLAFLRGETAESALVLGSEAYKHKQMEEARGWMERSASLDGAQAMYNMGVFWRDGLGGPRDVKTALAWFGKAAAAGWKGAAEEVARLRAASAKE